LQKNGGPAKKDKGFGHPPLKKRSVHRLKRKRGLKMRSNPAAKTNKKEQFKKRRALRFTEKRGDGDTASAATLHRVEKKVKPCS